MTDSNTAHEPDNESEDDEHWDMVREAYGEENV